MLLPSPAIFEFGVVWQSGGSHEGHRTLYFLSNSRTLIPALLHIFHECSASSKLKGFSDDRSHLWEVQQKQLLKIVQIMTRTFPGCSCEDVKRVLPLRSTAFTHPMVGVVIYGRLYREAINLCSQKLKIYKHSLRKKCVLRSSLTSKRNHAHSWEPCCQTNLSS